jgi:hypothetical protein
MLVTAMAFPHHAAQETAAPDARAKIQDEERCGGE